MTSRTHPRTSAITAPEFLVGEQIKAGKTSCRLLYVVGQLRLGGSERQLYYLLKGLDRSRYQPEVVVWNFSESDIFVAKIRSLGVPLHALPSKSRAQKLRAFRRIVTEIRPEIVHSYSFYTNFAAFCATAGTSSIAVGGMRSDFAWAVEQTGALWGRLSAYWPRRQVFNSHSAVASARRSRSLFVPKQCLVVRNGLDLVSLQSTPLPSSGKAHILGIGSLYPVKRWDRLICAALALKQRGFDFAIRIVGDGPLGISLKQQAYSLGVADYVEFLGRRDDIPALLAEATFLVHPSDNEGCPNVVMEAMACGRAVVATDVGDVPDLVKDGKTGFVVCRGDDAMLVERMATLIRDRNLCNGMGLAGRIVADRGFGLDFLVSQTLVAYRSAGWIGTEE